jgi:hypothetical protein
MKPPLPRTSSSVPRLPHVQLEIAKAIRTLAGPEEDELLRQRRAEIAPEGPDGIFTRLSAPRTMKMAMRVDATPAGQRIRGRGWATTYLTISRQLP